MALITMEGFESLGNASTTTADIQTRMKKRYPGIFSNGNGVRLLDSVDSDGFALAWGTISTANANALRFDMVDQKANTVVVGFRFRPSNATATREILEIRSIGFSNDHLNLRVVNTADIEVRRHNTVLATASAVLTKQTWHYIEFKFHVDNTNGTYDLRVNGVSKVSASSVDTQDGSGSALVNLAFFLGFNSVSSSDMSAIDDVYILNTTGSVNNDFLGDAKIMGRLPNGEGATNDWTPSSGLDNSALVDEVDESASDYVESSTVGNIDKYTFVDETNTTIHAVRVDAVAATVDDGESGVRLQAYSGASTGNGADQRISDPDKERQVRQVFETDPNTSAAWTKTNLNAAEFGMEVRT